MIIKEEKGENDKRHTELPLGYTCRETKTKKERKEKNKRVFNVGWTLFFKHASYCISHGAVLGVTCGRYFCHDVSITVLPLLTY